MKVLLGLAAGRHGLVFKGNAIPRSADARHAPSFSGWLNRYSRFVNSMWSLAGEIVIDRSLTHEELANMVGATRNG